MNEEERKEKIKKENKNEKQQHLLYSTRSGMYLLIFLCFCGFSGLHRFYVGKKITGIMYLCTFGFLGLGLIYDLLLIFTGKFTDDEGRIVQTTIEKKSPEEEN